MVVDFEYDNFCSMLHCLSLDVELKYHGVSFDEEILGHCQTSVEKLNG